MRVVASAPFARIGDGPIGPRRTFLLMVCGTAIGYAAFAFVHGFWSIALVMVAMSAFLAPTVPLLDVIVLQGVTLHGHDYGRIRQWGSLAWLLASVSGGAILGRLPIESRAADPRHARRRLPSLPGLPCPTTASSASARPVDTLAGEAPGLALFALFCAGIACLQGAHSFLYSFGTLIFERNGFSSAEIGLLWAVGVVLETALFLFAGNLAGWLGPYRFDRHRRSRRHRPLDPDGP